MKQDFMRGQPYRITEHVELKGPHRTSYQVSMHGLPAKNKSIIIDKQYTSCGVGAAIPDPNILNVNA